MPVSEVARRKSFESHFAAELEVVVVLDPVYVGVRRRLLIPQETGETASDTKTNKVASTGARSDARNVRKEVRIEALQSDRALIKRLRDGRVVGVQVSG